MRIWLSVAVVALGIVVLSASATALYSYGITADENGFSGWNPPLWILLLSGSAIAVLGLVQLATMPRKGFR